MPITLEDIPEFEGEYLRVEIARRVGKSLRTGMFYLTDRKSIAIIGGSAIRAYGVDEDGKYTRQAVIPLAQIERLSPLEIVF